LKVIELIGVPTGSRTPVTGVKGRKMAFFLILPIFTMMLFYRYKMNKVKLLYFILTYFYILVYLSHVLGMMLGKIFR